MHTFIFILFVACVSMLAASVVFKAVRFVYHIYIQYRITRIERQAMALWRAGEITKDDTIIFVNFCHYIKSMNFYYDTAFVFAANSFADKAKEEPQPTITPAPLVPLKEKVFGEAVKSFWANEFFRSVSHFLRSAYLNFLISRSRKRIEQLERLKKGDDILKKSDLSVLKNIYGA